MRIAVPSLPRRTPKPSPARELSLAEIEAAEAGMPGLAELERIAAETVEKIPIRIGDDPEF